MKEHSLYTHNSTEVLGRAMELLTKLLDRQRRKMFDESRLAINPFIVALLYGAESDVSFWSAHNDYFNQTELGLALLALKTLHFMSVSDLKTAKEVGAIDPVRCSVGDSLRKLREFVDRHHSTYWQG